MSINQDTATIKKEEKTEATTGAIVEATEIEGTKMIDTLTKDIEVKGIKGTATIIRDIPTGDILQEILVVSTMHKGTPVERETETKDITRTDIRSTTMTGILIESIKVKGIKETATIIRGISTGVILIGEKMIIAGIKTAHHKLMQVNRIKGILITLIIKIIKPINIGDTSNNRTNLVNERH